MKVKKQLSKLFKNKLLVITLAIFLLELFLRFYNIERLNPYGYDQVDNAWVAKNLIIDGKIPLVGMVAKANSGIYIGPAYYYMASFFYWVFDLHPIASGVFAGVTSIFTFWALFFVTKKMFSWEVAIIAVFINTVALYGIIFDRIQWPVNFIPGISLLIFYFLYRVITGSPKFIMFLALAIGFAFQIHFTSIFYIILVFVSLPFFPRTFDSLKYILISVPLFLIWLIPNFIAQFGQKNSQGSDFINYLNTYYHGLHLRRMIQLLGDGVIMFEKFLPSKFMYPVKFILLPIFFIVYLYKSFDRKKLLLCYLIFMWFFIPLLVFTTYKGEISDYYFSNSRFIALMIISYLIYRVYLFKNKLIKVAVIFVLFLYAGLNLKMYYESSDTTLYMREQEVLKKIKRSEIIYFQEGVPESYIYDYYMKYKKIEKKDIKIDEKI